MGIQVGTNIRKLRELKDYTQEHMADALGCSQSYYARIENNTADISIGKLEEIAKVLDTTPQHLLSFDSAYYIQSISHSQVGAGQYLDQRAVSTEQLSHYQQQLDDLREEVRFLRKLLEKRI